MEVYLIPVGDTKYRLYSESAVTERSAEDEVSVGMIRRLYRYLRDLIVTEEGVRDTNRTDGSLKTENANFITEINRRIRYWINLAIADQRLLWALARHHKATIVHPDDLDAARAIKIMRSVLQRDIKQHRFWLIFDGLAALVLGPLLFFVPGPNLIAYYFLLRMVGRLLSVRGARHALSSVVWHCHPSTALSDLRRMNFLNPLLRAELVRDVAARLRLKRFVLFVERITI